MYLNNIRSSAIMLTCSMVRKTHRLLEGQAILFSSMYPIKGFNVFMQVLFKEHHLVPQEEAMLTGGKVVSSFITEQLVHVIDVVYKCVSLFNVYY